MNSPRRTYGLSSDTKPVAGCSEATPPAVGDLFVELDTGASFTWTGGDWHRVVVESPPELVAVLGELLAEQRKANEMLLSLLLLLSR